MPTTDTIHDHPWLDLFGDTPRTQLFLTFFTADLDLTYDAIMNRTDVSNTAYYNHIETLVDAGILTQTREYYDTPFYQLNPDHPAVDHFLTQDPTEISIDDIHEHPLLDLFGDTPRARIFLTFLTADDAETPLSRDTIIDRADISNGAYYNHIPDLVDAGILTETRTDNNAAFYHLNTDHPAVDHFLAMCDN